jgi:hypothetical protein
MLTHGAPNKDDDAWLLYTLQAKRVTSIPIDAASAAKQTKTSAPQDGLNPFDNVTIRFDTRHPEGYSNSFRCWFIQCRDYCASASVLREPTARRLAAPIGIDVTPLRVPIYAVLELTIPGCTRLRTSTMLAKTCRRFFTTLSTARDS